MARRFLDDIRADILSELPDNTVGAITPAIVRGILRDMCDSLAQDECALTSPPSAVVNLTTTPTEYPQIFDAVIGGAPGFLVGNATTGRFELSPTPGFSYTFRYYLQAEGNQNAELNFNIVRDGVVVGETYEIIARGPGRGTASAAAWYELTGIANGTFGLALSSPGSDTFTITNAFAIASIVPTNNP